MIAWEMFSPVRVGLGPQLASELPQAVRVDNQTGSVSFDEVALRATLVRVADLANVDEAVQQIVAFFEPGMLQPLHAHNQAGSVPWGVIQGFLETERSAPHFLLRELGVTRIRTEEGLLRKLDEQFVSVPGFLHEPRILTQLLSAARARDDVDTGWWDPGEGPRPPSGRTAPPPPPPPLPDVTTCLSPPSGIWSTDAWGVVLCLDAPCAESFAYALESYTLAGSPDAIAKLAAKQAAAVIGGSVSFVNFTVMVAITVGIGTLKINILTENQNSQGRGVCIHFFDPWIPLVGGTAWASAR
jgi:hypothetical protein